MSEKNKVIKLKDKKIGFTRLEITKTEKELLIKFPIVGIRKIPLYQKEHNVYMESKDNPDGYVGDCDNFVGCIEGDKFGFVQVISLAYKGSFDYGDFLVEFSKMPELITLKEFKKVCKEFDIYLFSYPICSKCGKILYGCFGWSDTGETCDECIEKENKTEK